MPRSGFTLIEVLIVIAMMGAIMLMASPFLSNTTTQRGTVVAMNGAVDALREAQSSVMSGKNNAKFGVHFEGGRYTFFQGATYSSSDPENVAHILDANVTVTAVTLSPGGSCTLPAGTGNCDVHFINHFGTPTETGTIVFTGDDGTTKTVTVGAAGMIDMN